VKVKRKKKGLKRTEEGERKRRRIER